MRCLCTNNHKEYTFKEFWPYYGKEGITCHLTIVYTPKQNDVVERLNRTLLERSRSMLSQASLPLVFWVEVVSTTPYLVNLSPSSAIGFKTAFEIMHGRVVNYSGLQSFGCDTYTHIPREKRTKLDPKATKCIFLGYQ